METRVVMNPSIRNKIHVRVSSSNKEEEQHESKIGTPNTIIFFGAVPCPICKMPRVNKLAARECLLFHASGRRKRRVYTIEDEKFKCPMCCKLSSTRRQTRSHLISKHYDPSTRQTITKSLEVMLEAGVLISDLFPSSRGKNLLAKANTMQMQLIETVCPRWGIDLVSLREDYIASHKPDVSFEHINLIDLTSDQDEDDWVPGKKLKRRRPKTETVGFYLKMMRDNLALFKQEEEDPDG